MNRNQVIKRANKIVWNTMLRRTMLMALAGISLLGIVDMINFISSI